MLIGELIRSWFTCKTCEELRAQIAHERWQTQELLKHITYKSPVIEKEPPKFEPIRKRVNARPPWDVDRQTVEEELRLRTERMEKELGITNTGTSEERAKSDVQGNSTEAEP